MTIHHFISQSIDSRAAAGFFVETAAPPPLKVRPSGQDDGQRIINSGGCRFVYREEHGRGPTTADVSSGPIDMEASGRAACLRGAALQLH